ncbi:MAG TPA: IS91 family transposase, partial [Burkholderiaceae bacterium]|nr:IS91 family transposase [Burkholderiaceae bacterium]
MSAGLAQVLRTFGPVFLREHALTTLQAQVWRDVVACRTPALGGRLQQCDGCGRQQPLFNSCRNRHCPSCQTREQEAWRQARLGELLDVPYCHLVFTLPHEINALAHMHAHPRWVYRTLMGCVARTLSEFAANPQWLGGTGAFTLVLHTWTQDLRVHLHVHAVMACGALADDGSWVSPKRSPTFLFPVHALSKVFKGKFLAALQEARANGQLPRDPATPAQQQRRLAAMQRHPWVVYAKTPLAGPAQVLDYLARYTHRVAVSNERIEAVEAGGVRLRVRDNERGGTTTVRIDGVEFIRRFLCHVVPRGFKRVRHYGLLAPGHKAKRLSRARAALRLPQPSAAACEHAQAFNRRIEADEAARCAHCKSGRWFTVLRLPKVDD